MKIKEVNISNDEFMNKTPKILYKYRSWSNENHKSILLKREVYFAPPSSFTDKYDCKIPTRYDLLTERQWNELYMFNSKKINPHYARAQHRQYIRQNFLKNKINSKSASERFNEETFYEFSKRFGVLT